MTNYNDKISVLIPVKNGADKIDQCLNAVFSQTLNPLEVIVIDGHSIDQTAEIALKYPIKLFYENYRTRAGACQVGLENASGDYIAFTDADCIPDKQWLENLVKEFSNETVGIAGLINDIGNKGIWIRTINNILKTTISGTKSRVDSKGFKNSLAVVGCNGICRRDALLQAGGFNVETTGGEDLEMGKKLSKMGKLFYTPDAVVLHDHARGVKEFAKQVYWYGRWRKESGVWEAQSLPPLIAMLLLLSIFIRPWFFIVACIVYFILIFAYGIYFTIKEKYLAFLLTIPIMYIITHGLYTFGFWREIFWPAKKPRVIKGDVLKEAL